MKVRVFVVKGELKERGWKVVEIGNMGSGVGLFRLGRLEIRWVFFGFVVFL